MTDYNEWLMEKYDEELGQYYQSKAWYDLVQFFINGGISLETLEAVGVFLLDKYMKDNKDYLT